MAKVKGKKEIKANILENNVVINAKVIKSSEPIKSKISEIPIATTNSRGIIRIATDTETINGNATNIAITPHTLKLATHYTHIQGEASDTWIINHNLNKKPSITIVDSAGNVVEGAEKYIDENTIEIYFNGAFKGEAYLN